MSSIINSFLYSDQRTHVAPIYRPGLDYWQSLKKSYETELAEGTLTPEREQTYKTLLSTQGINYSSTHEDEDGISLKIAEDTWEHHPQSVDLLLDPSLRSYERDAQWTLDSMMHQRITQMQDIFVDFKNQLRVSLPDLADKNFGFTINEHGNLEVTSPAGALTEVEINQLNGWLNDQDDLKELTFEHAKLLIHKYTRVPDLAKYDGMVTIKNIYKFIDYGMLLQNGGTSPAKGFSWIEQLQVQAEKILERKGIANNPI
ncbi:MAG TPA: hypothetical protein VF682_06230 [Pseudomonas sp.]